MTREVLSIEKINKLQDDNSRLLKVNEIIHNEVEKLYGEVFAMMEHMEILVDAISEGARKFDYDTAPFLHDAMEKHFEFITGIHIGEILDEKKEVEQ